MMMAATFTGCARTLPPPTFADHVGIHERAEYAKGAGAVLYLSRVQRNDGRVAYLQELDGYLLLLRQLTLAFEKTTGMQPPPKATASYGDAIADELRALQQEGDQVGKLVRDFLSLGAARRLVEVLPEIVEARRLAKARGEAAKREVAHTGWPAWSVIAGLSDESLLNDLRLLGSGPAACGAETPDPTTRPGMPDFFIQARDSEGAEVQVSAELKRLYARIRSATKAQRKAMGQYGPYKSIFATKNEPGAKNETWVFQVGSVERSGQGSTAVDFRPRALRIECEYNQTGDLDRAREIVVDQNGDPVVLFPADGSPAHH